MTDTLEYRDIIRLARERLPAFEALVKGVPYEAKGIINSEILFLLACASFRGFNRILESGRARGQSTLMLATCLPGTSIISYEKNLDSPDAPVATKRLSGHPHVRLEYGDATEMIPRVCEPGDLVLIDGPKSVRGIGLAIDLLGGGKVSQAFVHDLPPHTLGRKFVAKHFPEARFSDHVAWAEFAATLDHHCLDRIPPSRRLGGFPGQHGYGFSLTWVPHVEGRDYRALSAKLRRRGLMHRLTGF
jgi:hypothetical protein